ncbi:MAG TPA: hypothetical protein VMV00_01385 [Candidatus Baltobacteraceae bacterium]|nr:hypothetical protein [Candidatus Baltobacteraceae bacterium]
MPINLKSFSIKEIAIIAAIVVAIAVVGIVLYTTSVLSAYKAQAALSANVITPFSTVGAHISSQNLLTYNNGAQLAPYVIVSYSVTNSTYVVANSTLFKSQIPSRIYFLNISDECFNCANTAAIEQSVISDLVHFRVINSSAPVAQISISNIGTIQPNSILVVLNGLMPSSMFANMSGRNVSTLQYLLQKGTSILYTGQDFSHVLLPGSIVVPNPNPMPSFMATSPGNSTLRTPNYFIAAPTFAFSSGANLGGITYVNAYNGSVVAFPDTPNTWQNSTYVGFDISKAILGLFWLQKYASGTGFQQVTVKGTNTTSGEMGVALTDINFPYSYQDVATANSGGLRTIVYAYSIVGMKLTNITYVLLYSAPHFTLNGTVGLPSKVTPVQQVPLTMTIFSNATSGVNIQPHLTIYNTYNKTVLSEPLSATTIHGNFTFLKYLTLNLPAGQYVALLQSFSGTQYGGGYFSVYPINVTQTYHNYTTQTFNFYLFSGGAPLTGIPYHVSLNGLYKANGTVQNGTISYRLPSGTPAIYGVLGFNITMPSLSQSVYYAVYNAPPIITINKQYVELGIVGVIVLLMVVLVKAPNRDEFYIDVPSLPRMQRTEIKLKPRELLAVFDKLNLYYHWKFMPLSKAELRTGIATNIRFGNMPVSLTYGNVEIVLDQMAVKGYVEGADELYAPKDWIKQSGHDIEYLATFKKMRIYLVTHAYVFTDIDSSNLADIVATLHGERKYIAIHSKTSKFQKLPIYANSKTYLVFLNSYALDQFREGMNSSMTKEAEELKIYISTGYVKLIDADNPDEMLE